MVSPKFWEYYLHIEADLENCSRYVEFSKDNFDTYSNEFARIIVVACAEIDTILKELCSSISPGSSADNINKYWPIITMQCPKFTGVEIEIARSGLRFQPWLSWAAKKSPDWWGNGYNDIKHDRTNNFKKANLQNALNAVGALFIAVVQFHEHANSQPLRVDLNRGTQLFTPAKPIGDESGINWFYSVQ
ncbi:MAG: hypothetical protein ACRCV9_14900 [Burkholderiaceae bacterium]